MKKILFVILLIVLIAIVPCIIEGVRSGDFSPFPALITLTFLGPAEIIYSLLAETRINIWIIRSVLSLYGILLLYWGITALSAELHGPLFGYWILPATIIFIPAIMVLPSTSFYKNGNSNKAVERNSEPLRSQNSSR